jgi:hypothetical protein
MKSGFSVEDMLEAGKGRLLRKGTMPGPFLSAQSVAPVFPASLPNRTFLPWPSLLAPAPAFSTGSKAIEPAHV